MESHVLISPIHIVIVNYRTAGRVCDCLASLAGEVASSPGTAVRIVDNASGDGSAEQIRARIAAEGWSWAQVIESGRNAGFGAGNNVAIRASLAEADPPSAILLLNPDTLVKPGLLRELTGFMESNPEAGIVGGLLLSCDGQPQSSGHRFPQPMLQMNVGAELGVLDRLLPGRLDAPLDTQEPTRHDWVTGACMMIRRDVLEDVGLFDEGFFLYFEEVDLARRAARFGWECWVAPAARVVHDEGAATGIAQTDQPRPTFWYDSRRRYFRKHHGLKGLMVADALWGIGHLSLAWRRWSGLGGEEKGEPRNYAKDLLLGDVKAILRRERVGVKEEDAVFACSALTGRCAATSPAGRGVGVVVIGRNEGERLRLCLESVAGRRVVYVDSGSTDGSVALARSTGAEVVELDLSFPFTAARARNAGFASLDGVEFVQFIDGDCEMIAGWLERADRTLRTRPKVAVVCGRLRERFPERSIYNRLSDMEWDAPAGEVESSGGVFMARAESLRAVGGFNPSIRAGEEPELCHRLRKQCGVKVLRLPAEMATHDAHMHRFGQWWRRQVRGGEGGMEVAARYGVASFRKMARSALLWSVGWLMLTVVVGWFGGVVGMMLALAILPLQAVRVALKGRRRGLDRASAAVYGGLTVIGNWAIVWGQMRYAWGRWGVGRKRQR